MQIEGYAFQNKQAAHTPLWYWLLAEESLNDLAEAEEKTDKTELIYDFARLLPAQYVALATLELPWHASNMPMQSCLDQATPPPKA